MKRVASDSKLPVANPEDSLKKKKLQSSESIDAIEPRSQLRRSASSNAMEKLKKQLNEHSASSSESESSSAGESTEEMEAECSCEEMDRKERKKEKQSSKKQSKASKKEAKDDEKKPKKAKKPAKSGSTVSAEKPKLVKKNTKHLGEGPAKKRSNSRSSSNLADLVIDHVHKPHRAEGNTWIGAHVSAAGGVDNAVVNATKLRANSFAMFLKNQRQWAFTPLEQETIDRFKKLMAEHGFAGHHVLPHGSYLVNLGNPDAEKRAKGMELFVDDLERCDKLGITLYTFHPGSTVGECTAEESMKHIANCINDAHARTKHVTITLENMAGQKNVIGSKFEQLARIIELVKDKERVGVCFDTCHAFAAGYDVRTKESFSKVLDDFEKIVGLKYLKAIHLNDSKGGLGDGKDRHEQLGKGYIGIDAFKFVMSDKRFHNIPIILETPAEDQYEDEIDLLYSFYQK